MQSVTLTKNKYILIDTDYNCVGSAVFRQKTFSEKTFYRENDPKNLFKRNYFSR